MEPTKAKCHAVPEPDLKEEEDVVELQNGVEEDEAEELQSLILTDRAQRKIPKPPFLQLNRAHGIPLPPQIHQLGIQQRLLVRIAGALLQLEVSNRVEGIPLVVVLFWGFWERKESMRPLIED
jgi:hypothetical protein